MSVSFSPPHGNHVFRWIKISRTFFDKGHPRNIPVKSNQGFQTRRSFLRISSCPYISPYDGSKFRKQFMIRVTQGTYLVKIFQILTSSFGKDFLRISSCPYSAKSLFSPPPPPPRPGSYLSPPPPPFPLHGGHVSRRIKISRTIFEKGHTRHSHVKSFKILTSGFVEDF